MSSLDDSLGFSLWNHLSQKLPLLGIWYAFKLSCKKYLPMPLLLCTCSKSWSGVTGSSLPCEGWRASKHLLYWKWTWDVWHLLPRPPTARWKAQLLLRSRVFMAFSRGLEFPLILLFIFHMIHIVWGFNSRFPGEHFDSATISCGFIQHIFVRCLLCSWQCAECWGFRTSEAQILPLGYQVA